MALCTAHCIYFFWSTHTHTHYIANEFSSEGFFFFVQFSLSPFRSVCSRAHIQTRRHRTQKQIDTPRAGRTAVAAVAVAIRRRVVVVV